LGKIFLCYRDKTLNPTLRLCGQVKPRTARYATKTKSKMPIFQVERTRTDRKFFHHPVRPSAATSGSSQPQEPFKNAHNQSASNRIRPRKKGRDAPLVVPIIVRSLWVRIPQANSSHSKRRKTGEKRAKQTKTNLQKVAKMMRNRSSINPLIHESLPSPHKAARSAKHLANNDYQLKPTKTSFRSCCRHFHRRLR
jgi:hypothetical protein